MQRPGMRCQEKVTKYEVFKACNQVGGVLSMQLDIKCLKHETKHEVLKACNQAWGVKNM